MSLALAFDAVKLTLLLKNRCKLRRDFFGSLFTDRSLELSTLELREIGGRLEVVVVRLPLPFKLSSLRSNIMELVSIGAIINVGVEERSIVFSLDTGFTIFTGFTIGDLTLFAGFVWGLILVTGGLGWGAGGFFRGGGASPCEMVVVELVCVGGGGARIGFGGCGARFGFGATVLLFIFGTFLEQSIPMTLSLATIGDGNFRGAVSFRRLLCCNVVGPPRFECSPIETMEIVGGMKKK